MRRFTVLAGVVALAAGSLVVASPAGAGGPGTAAPLTIEKVVEGPVPPGTQFVVTIACEGSEAEAPQIIDNFPNSPLSSKTVTFDETGAPVGPNVLFFVGPGFCIVTETGTGGAAQVSYACAGQILEPPPPSTTSTTASNQVDGGFSAQNGLLTDPCAAAGPQTEPMTVFIEAPFQDAAVTVTNTFPPTPVVIAPTFTG